MPKNSQWCDVRAGEGEEAHTTCCHTEPKPPWHPGVSQPAHTKQRAAGLPQHRPVAGSWYKCEYRCGAGRRFRSSRLAAGKWRERGWRELIISLPRGRNGGLGGKEEVSAACPAAEWTDSSQMSSNPSLPPPASLCTLPLSQFVLPIHFQELPQFSKSCRDRREVPSVTAWGAVDHVYFVFLKWTLSGSSSPDTVFSPGENCMTMTYRPMRS